MGRELPPRSIPPEKKYAAPRYRTWNANSSGATGRSPSSHAGKNQLRPSCIAELDTKERNSCRAPLSAPRDLTLRRFPNAPRICVLTEPCFQLTQRVRSCLDRDGSDIEWRNQNQFDYSTISRRIWKNRPSPALAIPIAWQPFPNENSLIARASRQKSVACPEAVTQFPAKALDRGRD